MVYAYRYFYKEKFMSRFICNTLLLTNDDGFDAPGLKILEKVCQRLAKEVWVVAPACDRSGTSQSLSLHTPLRFRQKGVIAMLSRERLQTVLQWRCDIS